MQKKQYYLITWKDGMKAQGQFIKIDKGFYLLLDRYGKKIVAHKQSITFKRISSLEYCDSCECDPCDC